MQNIVPKLRAKLADGQVQLVYGPQKRSSVKSNISTMFWVVSAIYRSKSKQRLIKIVSKERAEKQCLYTPLPTPNSTGILLPQFSPRMEEVFC
jgi:hypothetical protein